MSDRPGKDGRKKSFTLPDVVYAVLTSATSSGFLMMIIAVLAFTGSVTFNISNAFWFLLFTFAFSVLAGTLVYMARAKRKAGEAQEIAAAADKICKGQYDISLPEFDGQYKKVAKSLENVAAYLKRSEQANNDFINDFSHELKTPIVSIRGFAKLLVKGGLTEEEQKEYLDVIAKESDRLIDLTAGTLLLDRLDNNRFDVEIALYNVSEQLRRCILLLQNDWEEKNIDIYADFYEFFVKSNEELTSQLFLNVLQNAVKFTPENGRIDVTVTENDKNTVVTVKDNGVGMDAETRRRMFDKYFRGDKSRSTPGNGLGLATVKRIAEVTGVTLDVKSEEGKGTEFSVIFKK